MAKNTNFDVRGHTQEREWLVNLGGGNIVEGVRNLIEDMKDKRTAKNESPYSSTNKRNKLFKWRD